MRPAVYALREDLDDIKVPITTFGVGWRAPDGRWSRTKRFGFNDASRQLIARIGASNLMASVRDFHTQNVLTDTGVTRVVMTGCPALYSLDHIGKPLAPVAQVKRITVSLGVHFSRSRLLETQAKELVRALRCAFNGAEVVVAFHHSVDQRYAAAYGKASYLYEAQLRFRDWLEDEGVGHADLSGSAEKLLEHYGTTDLHVGYRVHAHILMTSIRKPSLLLAEDGRGMALKDVIGGHIVDAFEDIDDGKTLKAARKLGLKVEPYEVSPKLADDVVRLLERDADAGWPRAHIPVAAVERFLPSMKRFVEALP